MHGNNLLDSTSGCIPCFPSGHESTKIIQINAPFIVLNKAQYKSDTSSKTKKLNCTGTRNFLFLLHHENRAVQLGAFCVSVLELCCSPGSFDILQNSSWCEKVLEGRSAQGCVSGRRLYVIRPCRTNNKHCGMLLISFAAFEAFGGWLSKWSTLSIGLRFQRPCALSERGSIQREVCFHHGGLWHVWSLFHVTWVLSYIITIQIWLL